MDNGTIMLNVRIREDTATGKLRSRHLPRANIWRRKRRWTMKNGGRTIQQIGHPP
jgi:hypothetical protein